MTLTINQIKQLVEKYPYLAPHNSWTGQLVEEYDYSYTEAWAIPEGWHKLFFLLCKELRPHLVKSNLLDKFYFTQLKEKYGTMRVYTSALPDSVGHMIDIYESYSKYVCQHCGNKTAVETGGWIEFLCVDCFSKHPSPTSYNIHHKNVMTLESYDPKQGRYRINISYRPLRNQYNRVKNMTDEQFFKFLMED